MRKTPTTYRVVTDVTLNKKHLVTLNLHNEGQNKIAHIIKRIGFTDKEYTEQEDMLTVHRPLELAKGSYMPRRDIFLNTYWKLAKIIQNELGDEDEKYISSMGLDIQDENDVELIKFKIDFTSRT